MKKGIVLLICSLGFSWPHSYALKTAHAFPINNKYEYTGTITGAQQILAKAPYRYQFWYDKPSKKIRLIGINHSETAFAGRETGEISANLLTNQFIAEWTRWEGPDLKPNKQTFKSEIHNPKIYLTHFDQFFIDKFDERLMRSIGKAKEAWNKSTSRTTQQPQRFPMNTSMEFTGTISGQPVLVELTDTENGLNGRYKYLEIGKIISLEGVIDPQHNYTIELAEGEQKRSRPRPAWQAVYRNDSIIGKWYSADRTKTYAIALTEKVVEESPVSFKRLKRDTVVYSHPKDTTLPAFTYHNSILQAKGNKELSQWLNAELMKTYPSYKPQYSIEKNMSKDMKDYILGYLERVADAGYPEYESWNWDYDNAQYEDYYGQGYLTIYTSGYEFSGGAHGNAWEVYDNYDIKNRKKLRLSAVITIDSTKISTLLEKKFRQEYDVKEGETLKEFGLFENKIRPNNNFYFDDWGLTFVYNQYEIGPYVLGIIELFIPWNELGPYLKPTFMERMGLNY